MLVLDKVFKEFNLGFLVIFTMLLFAFMETFMENVKIIEFSPILENYN